MDSPVRSKRLRRGRRQLRVPDEVFEKRSCFGMSA
jgi:hypothetical protein